MIYQSGQFSLFMLIFRIIINFFYIEYNVLKLDSGYNEFWTYNGGYINHFCQPTRRSQWTVNPFSDKNPWWLYLAAGIPALLSTILIFLDQQITAVIVNRKENKLKVK